MVFVKGVVGVGGVGGRIGWGVFFGFCGGVCIIPLHSYLTPNNTTPVNKHLINTMTNT